MKPLFTNTTHYPDDNLEPNPVPFHSTLAESDKDALQSWANQFYKSNKRWPTTGEVLNAAELLDMGCLTNMLRAKVRRSCAEKMPVARPTKPEQVMHKSITVIRDAVAHYAPYNCQYTKRGDIQVNDASAVTCHHCKVRLGQGESCAPQETQSRFYANRPRFADIAPRYEGENTKRAPEIGDTHKCKKGMGPESIEYTSNWGWWSTAGGHSLDYCYLCGGFLPTQNKHEGNTASESYIDRARGFRLSELWDKLTDEERESAIKDDFPYKPQDPAARRKQEDAEIRAAWGDRYTVDSRSEVFLYDRFRENLRDKFLFSLLPASNPWGVRLRLSCIEQGKHLRFVTTPTKAECGHGKHYSRTGAELLALLFSEAPKSPHTTAQDFEHFLSYSGFHSAPQDLKDKLWQAFEAAWEPAAPRWHKVSEALPDDCKLVLVKVHGGHIGLAECYRRDRNNWKVTMPGVGEYWTRAGVLEWREI